jgi:uncharacterized protein GlcG (DUF336 family)
MLKWIAASAAIALVSTAALADDDGGGQCSIPRSTVKQLQDQLAVVTNTANFPDNNGGLFNPNRMWSAVVDRKGVLCSVINTGNDPWPGSRSIAIAKASTANDFSNSALALSTANLYALTQPGGSLYGLNNSNPFNPAFQPQGTGIGFVPGGIITFGGGVALYSGNQVIGGLGVSGDTACADHTIAFRMRRLAQLDGTPNSDNIQYAPFAVPGAPWVPPYFTSLQHVHCTGDSDSDTKDIPPSKI